MLPGRWPSSCLRAKLFPMKPSEGGTRNPARRSRATQRGSSSSVESPPVGPRRLLLRPGAPHRRWCWARPRAGVVARRRTLPRETADDVPDAPRRAIDRPLIAPLMPIIVPSARGGERQGRPALSGDEARYRKPDVNATDPDRSSDKGNQHRDKQSPSPRQAETKRRALPPSAPSPTT